MEFKKTLCNTALALLTGVCGALAAPAMADGVDGPVLKRIQERGAIYVAYREGALPFSYVGQGEGAEVTGYSWELCGNLVKAVEAAVGKSLKVIPVAASQNSRVMLVKTGMADMECGVTANTLGRQKMVSFSNTYFVSELRLMADSAKGISSMADLGGKRIAVVAGAQADRLVRQANLGRNLSLQIVTVDTPAEGVAMLAAGKVEAVAHDDISLLALRADAKLPESVTLLKDALAVEPYGVILPKEDERFRALVNKALGEYMRSDAFSKLYDKWFVSPLPDRPINLQYPMSPMIRSVIDYPNDRPAAM